MQTRSNNVNQVEEGISFRDALTGAAPEKRGLGSYLLLTRTVSASFAETIKSAEPISTVLIGLLFFNDAIPLRTYLTLVPICAGVGLSCFQNQEFSLPGFLLAAASNICFSSRAVLAKKLSISHADTIDEINLFADISQFGLMFLVPFAVLLEGSRLWEFISDFSQAPDKTPVNSTQFQQEDANTPSVGYLCVLLLLNGTMFACYNLTSYLVLKHVDLMTHSVLNVFRRVFIILVTSFYFAVYLSPFNMLGIAIAVVGVFLFGYCRSTEVPKSLL